MEPDYMEMPQLRAGAAVLGGLGRDARADYYNEAQAQKQANGPPITTICMSHVNATNSQLYEIRSRLYELRDRLDGPAPGQTAGNLAAKEVPPMGFAEAFTREAQTTSMLLADIDRLTVQLSGRL